MPGGNVGPYAVVSLAEAFVSIGPWTAADSEEPDAPVLRSGAGAVAASLDEEARRRGRFVPPLPASASWCTTGGMAANNAAGARSFRHGASQAWIHALEGIDAEGRPFRVEGPPDTGSPLHGPTRLAVQALDGLVPAGPDGSLRGWPHVRKNSSGYALDRFLPEGDVLQLLIGSEGTLAFLTHVEWRTAPLTPARGVALLPAHSPEDVVRLAQGARRIGTTACEFFGHRFLRLAQLDRDPMVGRMAREAYAILLLEVDGTADEVSRQLSLCGDLGQEVGGSGLRASSPEEQERLWGLRHAASPIIAREADRGRVSTQFVEDSVVPVEHLGAYLEGVDQILDETGFDAAVFGHAGDGNVHVNPLVDVESGDWEARVREALKRVVELVAELGGTLAGEHGDGRLRAPFIERIYGARFGAGFRAVKEAFDPAGILNPGVISPLPNQDPLEGFVPRRRAHPPPSEAGAQ